jgi:hypothetical protein
MPKTGVSKEAVTERAMSFEDLSAHGTRLRAEMMTSRLWEHNLLVEFIWESCEKEERKGCASSAVTADELDRKYRVGAWRAILLPHPSVLKEAPHR